MNSRIIGEYLLRLRKSINILWELVLIDVFLCNSPQSIFVFLFGFHLGPRNALGQQGSAKYFSLCLQILKQFCSYLSACAALWRDSRYYLKMIVLFKWNQLRWNFLVRYSSFLFLHGLSLSFDRVKLGIPVNTGTFRLVPFCIGNPVIKQRMRIAHAIFKIFLVLFLAYFNLNNER